jgi:hypothetical protein
MEEEREVTLTEEQFIELLQRADDESANCPKKFPSWLKLVITGGVRLSLEALGIKINELDPETSKATFGLLFSLYQNTYDLGFQHGKAATEILIGRG